MADNMREFVRSLDQKKYWHSANGKIRRKKMSTAHVASSIGWLERNADSIVAAMENGVWSLLMTFPEDPSDGVFGVMCGIEGEADELHAALMAPKDQRLEACAEIVRRTEMYQALLRDLVKASEEALR